MKTTKSLLIVLVLSYPGLACSMTKTIGQVKPFPVGDYQYAGYDSKGVKIVEGRLSITAAEPKRINSVDTIELKGNWQLNKIGDPGVIGGQVGTGDLIGSIVNHEVHIDLNPNINDANVVLVGTIEEKRFHGKWSFIGYAGPKNKGTFEATRK
jgi:hypothetical protein